MKVPARRDPVVWAACITGLGLLGWSMRAVLSDPLHMVWGQSIDAIHSLWIVWWLGQDPTVAWVEFPVGNSGAILPPLGMAMSWRVASVVGAPLAYSLLCVGSVLFGMVGLGLLTHQLTRSARAAVVAPLFFLVSRPVLSQVALGNPEAVSVGWLCLGIWAGLRWSDPNPAPSRRVQAGWSALVGALFAVSVIENPYTLVPGGVGAMVLALRRLRRPGAVVSVALSAVVGAALVAWRLVVVDGKPGGTLLPYNRLQWGAYEWQMYDLQTIGLGSLVWPLPLPRLAATPVEVSDANAHHFLGWSLLVLAVGALGRRTWPWLLGGGVACLLAMGSAPWGNPGPPGLFLGLNQLLSWIIAPVTQPERFLVFAVLALSVAAAIGLRRHSRHLKQRPRWRTTAWLVVVALVGLEGVTWGGPATDVPTLSTRPLECFEGLADGPVFTAETPELPGISASAGMFLQILHTQPGSHHGLSGWAASSNRVRLVRLRERFDAATRGRTVGVPLQHILEVLHSDGYRWLAVPHTHPVVDVFEPTVWCGGWAAIPIDHRFGNAQHHRPSAPGFPEEAPPHGRVVVP